MHCFSVPIAAATSLQEKVAFAEHVNNTLSRDPLLRDAGYLPLDPASDDLFRVIADGTVLCKLINAAAPETIDERALNVPAAGASLRVHRLGDRGGGERRRRRTLRGYQPIIPFGVVDILYFHRRRITRASSHVLQARSSTRSSASRTCCWPLTPQRPSVPLSSTSTQATSPRPQRCTRWEQRRLLAGKPYSRQPVKERAWEHSRVVSPFVRLPAGAPCPGADLADHSGAAAGPDQSEGAPGAGE
jgi:hypothetical protein